MTSVASSVVRYNHVAVMIDDRATPDEIRHARGDLLPRVMLDGL